MDISKTGLLIKKLRTELNLTQKDLADKLYISDKTVSKWERGVGLPDISIIDKLADEFNVSVELLLSGEFENDNKKRNKMKKMSFYVCNSCGNVIVSSNTASVICCEKKLKSAIAKESDEENNLIIQRNDGSDLVTTDHEMSKDHFISFVAIRKGTSIQLIETFPEWDLNIRDEDLKYCRLYFYCTNHGLFYQQIK